MSGQITDGNFTVPKSDKEPYIEYEEDCAEACERSPELTNRLLQAITKAQCEFITNTKPSELFGKLLENLLFITDSEYGFIGEVLYDPADSVYLKMHAISNISENEETRRFYKENVPADLEFRNLKTLFGAVLTTARPVISNDPDNDPRSGGRPGGHPSLNSFLGLPFFQAKNLLALSVLRTVPGAMMRILFDFYSLFLPLAAISPRHSDGIRSD